MNTETAKPGASARVNKGRLRSASWSREAAAAAKAAKRARAHIDACAEGTLDAGKLTGGTKRHSGT